MSEKFGPGDLVEVVSNTTAARYENLEYIAPGDRVRILFLDAQYAFVEVKGRTSASSREILSNSQYLRISDLKAIARPLIEDDLFRDILGG